MNFIDLRVLLTILFPSQLELPKGLETIKVGRSDGRALRKKFDKRLTDCQWLVDEIRHTS